MRAPPDEALFAASTFDQPRGDWLLRTTISINALTFYIHRLSFRLLGLRIGRTAAGRAVQRVEYCGADSHWRISLPRSPLAALAGLLLALSPYDLPFCHSLYGCTATFWTLARQVSPCVIDGVRRFLAALMFAPSRMQCCFYRCGCTRIAQMPIGTTRYSAAIMAFVCRLRWDRDRGCGMWRVRRAAFWN